jgi:signal transduction histidine kinase
VRDAVEAFRPHADELGLALTATVGVPIPADLDPERLGQIVANLVENALKYARTSVEVGVSAMSGTVTITVADDGPGIPPAVADRVFERLYTGRDGPGRSIGTGLGLAIVRELASTMGGTARVDPTGFDPDSTGTRFVVTVRSGAVAP